MRLAVEQVSNSTGICCLRKNSRPLVLAGGLNAENVAQAIKAHRPYAVDVSSGVEISAGIKDAKKIEKFVQTVLDNR